MTTRILEVHSLEDYLSIFNKHKDKLVTRDCLRLESN